MTPHGQVRLQQDAEIAHSGRGLYQGPTDTQLRGVKMHTPSTGRTLQEVRLLGVKDAVCWNASIRRSARYLAPFDAAAVQLLMEAPTCIAESRRHRSGMTGRDWQQAQPGRRCRAGTAAAQVRSPEGRHIKESGRYTKDSVEEDRLSAVAE